MKITAFNPLIVTSQAEPVISLFEELGFEQRHKKTDIENRGITSVDMKDANGNRVNIGQAGVPQDMMVIRMNVDDFDEALGILEKHGFTNPRGNVLTETSSSKSAFMVSPSGFAINLVKHLKK